MVGTKHDVSTSLASALLNSEWITLEEDVLSNSSSHQDTLSITCLSSETDFDDVIRCPTQWDYFNRGPSRHIEPTERFSYTRQHSLYDKRNKNPYKPSIPLAPIIQPESSASSMWSQSSDYALPWCNIPEKHQDILTASALSCVRAVPNAMVSLLENGENLLGHLTISDVDDSSTDFNFLQGNTFCRENPAAQSRQMRFRQSRSHCFSVHNSDGSGDAEMPSPGAPRTRSFTVNYHPLESLTPVRVQRDYSISSRRAWLMSAFNQWTSDVQSVLRGYYHNVKRWTGLAGTEFHLQNVHLAESEVHILGNAFVFPSMWESLSAIKPRNLSDNSFSCVLVPKRDSKRRTKPKSTAFYEMIPDGRVQRRRPRRGTNFSPITECLNPAQPWASYGKQSCSLREALCSLTFMSYRKDFAPLLRATFTGATGPERLDDFPCPSHVKITSDVGWGCAIRCGQMLLFQVLKRHLQIPHTDIQQQHNAASSVLQLRPNSTRGSAINKWVYQNCVPVLPSSCPSEPRLYHRFVPFRASCQRSTRIAQLKTEADLLELFLDARGQPFSLYAFVETSSDAGLTREASNKAAYWASSVAHTCESRLAVASLSRSASFGRAPSLLSQSSSITPEDSKTTPCHFNQRLKFPRGSKSLDLSSSSLQRRLKAPGDWLGPASLSSTIQHLVNRCKYTANNLSVVVNSEGLLSVPYVFSLLGVGRPLTKTNALFRIRGAALRGSTDTFIIRRVKKKIYNAHCKGHLGRVLMNLKTAQKSKSTPLGRRIFPRVSYGFLTNMSGSSTRYFNSSYSAYFCRRRGQAPRSLRGVLFCFPLSLSNSKVLSQKHLNAILSYMEIPFFVGAVGTQSGKRQALYFIGKHKKLPSSKFQKCSRRLSSYPSPPNFTWRTQREPSSKGEGIDKIRSSMKRSQASYAHATLHKKFSFNPKKPSYKSTRPRRHPCLWNVPSLRSPLPMKHTVARSPYPAQEPSLANKVYRGRYQAASSKSGTELLYLDPHIVQQCATDVERDWKTFRNPKVFRMRSTLLDPGLLLAFYCPTPQSVHQFAQMLQSIALKNRNAPLTVTGLSAGEVYQSPSRFLSIGQTRVQLKQKTSLLGEIWGCRRVTRPKCSVDPPSTKWHPLDEKQELLMSLKTDSSTVAPQSSATVNCTESPITKDRRTLEMSDNYTTLPLDTKRLARADAFYLLSSNILLNETAEIETVVVL